MIFYDAIYVYVIILNLCLLAPPDRSGLMHRCGGRCGPRGGCSCSFLFKVVYPCYTDRAPQNQQGTGLAARKHQGAASRSPSLMRQRLFLFPRCAGAWQTDFTPLAWLEGCSPGGPCWGTRKSAPVPWYRSANPTRPAPYI